MKTRRLSLLKKVFFMFLIIPIAWALFNRKAFATGSLTITPYDPEDGEENVDPDQTLIIFIDSGYMVGEVDNIRINNLDIYAEGNLIESFSNIYSLFCADMIGYPFTCWFYVSPTNPLPLETQITVELEAEVLRPPFPSIIGSATYSFTTRGITAGGAVYVGTTEEYLMYTQNQDYLSLVDTNNRLNVEDEYTIEVWIKPEMPLYQMSVPIISYVPQDQINFIYSVSIWPLFQAFQKNESKPRFVIVTAEDPDYPIGVDIISQDPIPDDGSTWTHVAITRTATTMKIYVNGVLKDSKDESRPFLNQDQAYFTLFTSIQNTKTLYFGAIDDLRISNTARNITENWNNGLYSSPLPVDGDTIALWKFDGDFTDEGPYGLDLTPNGNLEFIDGAVTPVEPTCTYASDVNCDTFIKIDDISPVLSSYSKIGSPEFDFREDVNQDNIVNTLDFGYVLKDLSNTD